MSDTGPPRYLICGRKDGLGSRLANLVWSWRLARRIDARLLSFWPTDEINGGKGLDVREIFDEDQLAAAPLCGELEIIRGRWDKHFRALPVDFDEQTFCDPLPLVVAAQLNQRIKASVPVLRGWRGPLWLEGETVWNAVVDAGRLLGRLPVHPRVRAALDQASRDQALSRTIAVHIRRGDVVRHLRTVAEAFASDPDAMRVRFKAATEHFFLRCAPLEAYARSVEPLLAKGYEVLVCTDSPELSERLAGLMSRRPRFAQSLAPPGLSAAQTALFDLLLMRQCHAVVGARSAFSLLAAYAGSGRLFDPNASATVQELISTYREVLGPKARALLADTSMLQIVLRQLRKCSSSEALAMTEDAAVRELVSRPADPQPPGPAGDPAKVWSDLFRSQTKAWHGLAEQFMRAGDLGGELEARGRALDIDDGDLKAHGRMARLLTALRRPTEADQHLRVLRAAGRDV